MSQIGLTPLKIGELEAAIELAVATDDPLFIDGPPGVGKTEISKQLAERKGWQYAEWLLAGRDIGDYMMPFVATVNGASKLTFHYNECLPIEGSTRFNRDEIILLNIDEYSGAQRLMQNFMLKALDEGKIGEANLLPNVRIIATGNQAQDLAHVEQMSAALANRGSRIVVTPDKDAWLMYGTAHGFHPVILAWVAFDESHLFNFNREAYMAGDRAFASPRSLERVSNLLRADDLAQIADTVFKAMVIGNIGQEQGLEFCGFRRMQRQMPDLNKIAETGNGAVPSDPSVLFATVTALLQRADPQSAANILTYFGRLPEEFQEQVANLWPRVRPELVNTAAWGVFMAQVVKARNQLTAQTKGGRFF